MSFEDSFLNFCLSCDDSLPNDNEHGPYCSQACRIADLEKSGSPNSFWPSTPTVCMYTQSSSIHSSTSSLPRSFPSSVTGFKLPPAIDFSIYRRDSPTSDYQMKPDTLSRRTSPTSGYSGFAPSFPTQATMWSQSNPSYISPEAKEELRRYESLFDQTRRRGNRAS